MKTLDLKKAMQLAFLPVVCVGVLSACASHERVVEHRNVVTTAESPVGAFERLDTSRDGFLSRAEVEPLGVPVYGRAPGVMSFEALDGNRDGFLSRAEAAPLVSSARMAGGRWIVITAASFDRLDMDRDGFLTRNEVAPILNPALFDRHDTNRDGFLSKAEAEPLFPSNVGGTR